MVFYKENIDTFTNDKEDYDTDVIGVFEGCIMDTNLSNIPFTRSNFDGISESSYYSPDYLIFVSVSYPGNIHDRIQNGIFIYLFFSQEEIETELDTVLAIIQEAALGSELY